MTIKERIEALTQSVELLAAMHRDNEKVMVDAINRIVNAHGELEQLVLRMGMAVDNLIVIVHDHETRIRAVEGN